MTRNYAFIVRAYNDIDQFTPIIWKLLIESNRVYIIIHTEIKYEDDYRISYLKSSGDLHIIEQYDGEYIKYSRDSQGILFKLFRRLYLLRRNPDSLIGKIYRKYYFNCIEQINFIRENSISTVIFEWGTPYSRGEVVEKIFKAAKGLGITTFALPHGCNIYKNSDVNSGYRKRMAKGLIPNYVHRSEFDYYIFQNPTRRDGFVKWGLKSDRAQCWGSSRYCPEWQKLNLEICPKFSPPEHFNSRVKIVFMHHQKDFNISISKIWSLLTKIVSTNQVHLVIKGSTRANKSYGSIEFQKMIKSDNNVIEVGNEVHSPSLIQWSDAVINFGSSIGLEVLMQNKILINPTYLHSNETLFETLGASLVANNDEEVLQYINKLSNKEQLSIDFIGIHNLYKEVCFGGRPEYDVLDYYYQQLSLDRLTY